MNRLPIIWARDMDEFTKDWFSFLGSADGGAGMLLMWTCQGLEKNAVGWREDSKTQQTKATQLGFFLDLVHPERVARSHKEHLTLPKGLRRHCRPMGS